MRTVGWRIIWKKTITVIDATFVACITGQVSQVRWTRHFLLSVNTCGPRWVEEPEQWTRNAWFNFTWNNAPPLPPQVHPLGFANFFLLEVYSPPLGTQKKTIPHRWAPDRQPHICFLLHLFDPYKSKMTRFHNFYECFPEFIERRIMDVII